MPNGSPEDWKELFKFMGRVDEHLSKLPCQKHIELLEKVEERIVEGKVERKEMKMRLNSLERRSTLFGGIGTGIVLVAWYGVKAAWDKFFGGQ